jgi:transposase InsO family protein
MTKLPFKGHFHPTKQSLEVIHADLVGPISLASYVSAQYFLTLIDQHTGFINVSLLAEKSDSTNTILNYKTHFEKQTGNQIEKLITDGGGEFCNKTLGDILKEAGIQHNVSPPYTSQHNDIAERANQTVIEMTRCMLNQANLEAEWWGDAVITATSTTNCLPSLAKSQSSPM